MFFSYMLVTRVKNSYNLDLKIFSDASIVCLFLFIVIAIVLTNATQSKSICKFSNVSVATKLP